MFEMSNGDPVTDSFLNIRLPLVSRGPVRGTPSKESQQQSKLSQRYMQGFTDN
jgi:hypothetical protein